MKYISLFIASVGLALIGATVFLGGEFPRRFFTEHVPVSTAPTPSLVIATSTPEEIATSTEPTMPEDISFAKNHTITPSFTEPEEKQSPIQPAPAPKTRIPQSELSAFGAAHVVNLFCELGNREVAIATGVILNDAGYILTNAHVAYTDDPKPCLIRNESPAKNFAIAERVFAPNDFSSDSIAYTNIIKDVAIWKITTFIGDNSLHGLSPIIIDPLYTPTIGSPLSTFSYPAELLGSEAIVRHLYLSFSETIVQARDSFIIESAQGIGSQKGSSGGVIIDPFTGAFAGLIFAINEASSSSVSDRHLFSLTPLAIDTAIRNETGKSLSVFLAEGR